MATPPPRSVDETAARYYRQAHERLLKVADSVPPAQFASSVGLSLHSIAWQLWHAARWDDFFAAHFMADFGRDPATQVWEREGLAAKWGFTAGSLGRRDAGTDMTDVDAENLRFPGKDDVVGYARRVFAFAESAIEAMRGRLEEIAKDDREGDSNLDNVFVYYEHLNRHLGMMEAVRGLLGSSGTAAR
jgi:hypothetical protein